jgi:hypothetical protein
MITETWNKGWLFYVPGDIDELLGMERQSFDVFYRDILVDTVKISRPFTRQKVQYKAGLYS